MVMLPLHVCTCAVEASSGQPLTVDRMLDPRITVQSLLKTPHRDSLLLLLLLLVLLVLLLLLGTSLGWQVAHVVAEDKETVGHVFGVFPPGRVPELPAGQHAAAAEALHPVALPQVEEARLRQGAGPHGAAGGPQPLEGPAAGVLAAHVGDFGVGGLVDHLSRSHAVLHVLRLLVEGETVAERSV